jgi:hypothetical protein
MRKDGYLESLRPRIDAAIAELRELDPSELARRAGLARDGETLMLTLLGKTYALDWPDLVARKPNGEPCRDDLRILFLDYLRHGDGSAPTGKWIGYQELPNGSFYRQAFQGYTGDQLVRDLGGDIEVFRGAAKALGGEPVELGDAAFAFRAFPNVPLAVVWWAGDEEFPANATVLFDEVAGRYLPTDGLAVLGRMLCRALAKAGTPS